MWQADPQQQTRIQALAQQFSVEIPAAWSFYMNQTPADLWQAKPGIFGSYQLDLPTEKIVEILANLTGHFGAEFMAQAVPEFLIFPDAHNLVKSCTEGCPGDRMIARHAQQIATHWLMADVTDSNIHWIGKRLESLLLNLPDDPLICNPVLRKVLLRARDHEKQWDFYSFHITQCLQFLVANREIPAAFSYLEKLLTGYWNGPVTFPKSAKLKPGETTRYAVVDYVLCRPFSVNVIDELCSSGWLDYERLTAISHRLPLFIPAFADLGRQNAKVGKQLYDYMQRLAWEIVQSWDTPRFCGIFRSLEYSYYSGRCSGPDWLFSACTQIEKLGLSSLTEKGQPSSTLNLLRYLAKAHNLFQDTSREEVLGKLREFNEQTLLAILPYAHDSDLVWEALGWRDLDPAMHWIFHGMAASPDVKFTFKRSTPGILDTYTPEILSTELRIYLHKLLANTDSARLQTVIKQWRDAHRLPSRSVYLYLEALAGWNRQALISSIEKYHTHAALAAYGLLPLEGGSDAVLASYLFFKKAAKDCAKYGAERQANTRAAVQIGLAHLAETAGYPDMARLEWAMEAKITDDGVPLNTRETIHDWEVELNLTDTLPQLTVYKQGKPLKAVPAGIKKLPRFLEFKETQTRMKAQIPRFRAALESLLMTQQLLTVADLNQLIRLPVMCNLLKNIVFRTESGKYGLFDPESMTLTGLEEEKTPLTEPVSMAHPYHFFQDNLLPDWQREIIRKRVVQPFKQVFRELYVVTPAELETKDFSNRFYGHALKPTVAISLLRARQWVPGNYDHTMMYKVFASCDLKAEFSFPDADSYLGGLESITSDQIHFMSGDQPVLLQDVPPIIFSEVMRDADLVVSVAQLRDQEDHWSAETFQRRAELITELVADIGIKGVRCHGHFAYVQGTLANYRVHLGSALIHIEPGNYLCIVPAGSPATKTRSLFLPFADAEPKTSEVISKILLLANDAQIKDQSILSQIKRQGQ